MLNIKLCVFDLDGTLLNSHGEISKENINGIKMLKERGISYTIATGRIDNLARRYQREIGSDLPIVCCNGSLIRDLDNNTLYKTTIDFNEVKELTKFYEENNLHFMFYNEEGILSSPSNPRLPLLHDFSNKALPQDRFEFFILDKNIEDYKHMNFLKALVTIDDRSHLLLMEKKLKERFKDLSIVSSSADLLDVMPKGVNKGSGVYNLCKILNISYDNVCSFGDNFNDLEMIMSSKLSIAPENSEEHIKSISSFISKSNNDHGVAYGIEEFLLKNV